MFVFEVLQASNFLEVLRDFCSPQFLQSLSKVSKASQVSMVWELPQLRFLKFLLRMSLPRFSYQIY